MHKHRYFWTFVFLVIFIAFTPLIDGWLFQKAYFDLTRIINKDGRFKIKVLQYQLGWLHSTVKVQITIDPDQFVKDELKSSPIILTVDEYITHGPIIYDRQLHQIGLGYAKIHSLIHVNKDLKNTIFGILTTAETIHLETLYKIDQDWHAKIYVPPLHFLSTSASNMDWQGMDGEFKLHLQDDKIEGLHIVLKFGALNFRGTPETFVRKLVIPRGVYRYDAYTEKTGLWSGATRLVFFGFSFTTSKGASFAGDKFVANSTFSVIGNSFYSTNLTLFLKNFLTNNPSIPFAQRFSISIFSHNLNAKSVSTYLNFFNSKTADALKLFDLQTLEKIFLRTITPLSSFDGNIIFSNATDKLNFEFKTTLSPGAALPKQISDLSNSTITQGSLLASPGMSKILIEIYRKQFSKTPSNSVSPSQTPNEILAELLKGGYVTQNNNDYLTTLIFQRGELLLNGGLINRP